MNQRSDVSALFPLQGLIALLALAGIACHLAFRLLLPDHEVFLGQPLADFPLLVVLVLGGMPLLLQLLGDVLRLEFGSDLLAGISIVTACLMGEYLAGALMVLMLSGGQTLENFAVRSASSVLQALAKRMPTRAHRQTNDHLEDAPLEQVALGDRLVVFPHEICPVDGIVVEGHGSMDEAYLTGEPYLMAKVPGSNVLSGAVNGPAALTIRTEKLPQDSRYAKIMEVMRDSEQRRPRLRRLADTLGAFYTPLAVALALAAWLFSGEPVRFLAVLVVATPCPLLIAIPVALIGSISLAARRGIIIKDPAVLERLDTCRIALFDKTGTLTYGKPRLTEVLPTPPHSPQEILALAASLERYSRHPLAAAVLEAAEEKQVPPHEAAEVDERPGKGLQGLVAGRRVRITHRGEILRDHPERAHLLPPRAPGMECIVLVDGAYAATLRFRDESRREGRPFIRHLTRRHGFERVLLVSGDQEAEVRHLAEQVGIKEIHAGRSPEEKLELVRRETARHPTVFLGDGINDAPALTAATVGIAFGQGSDVTAEAAGAVILDNSLQRVDELLHIGRRLRTIALQSAVGGMGLSLFGMFLAAAGWLTPVAGALAQEAIDVLAVLNALRVAWPPRTLTDY